MNRTLCVCALLGTLLMIHVSVSLASDMPSPPLMKTSRTIRAEGQPEVYSHTECGFPLGDRLIAVSSSGRWIAFPYLEAVGIASGTNEKTRGGELDWHVGVFDLRDPDAAPRRWRVGAISSHGPVAAGPDDTVLFLSQGPFPDAVDPLPPLPGLTKEQQKAQGIPESFPADYIRMTWCRTGKAVYYRMPAWKEGTPRPRSRSVVHDLWVGDNPVTKKPSLFALRFDGAIRVWELHNDGKPPTANVLRVDAQPKTLDVLDLLKGILESPATRWDGRSALLASAGKKSIVAVARQRQIILLPLTTGKAYAFERPRDIGASVYEDLLLSVDGSVCAASYAAQLSERSGRADGYPNVLAVWNAGNGKLFWEKKLPDTFFVSRAALHPEGSLLVTWSCPEPDQSRKFVSAEDEQRREEARFKRGVLHVWDVPTGNVLRAWSFPLTSWPHGIAFTPDGKHLTILELGGTCRLMETTRLTNAP